MKSEVNNKKMKIVRISKVVIISSLLLLNIIFLTGCNEKIEKDSEKSTNNFDEPNDTDDIKQIEITEYSVEKKRIMRWDKATQKWYKYDEDGRVKLKQRISGWLSHAEVPWDLDITNISTNLTKRKTIYLEYVESNESKWELDFNITDEPYTQYKHMNITYDKINQRYVMNTTVISNVRLENDTIWYIDGIVKNIGDSYLEYVNITVNFYDYNDTWLGKETDTIYNITSGNISNFDIRYKEKFKTDVSNFKFEVDAHPYS